MSYDRAIQNEWPGIKIGVAGSKGKYSSKAYKRDCTKLEAPVEGWIKVNFDGVSKGKPRKLGVGCIIRDHLGETLVFGAIRLPDGTNNEKEF